MKPSSNTFTISQPYISYRQRVFDSFSFVIGKVIATILVFGCCIGLLITHSLSFLLVILIGLPFLLGTGFLLGSFYSRTFLKELSIGEKIVLKTYKKDVLQQDITVDPRYCFAAVHESGSFSRQGQGLYFLEITVGGQSSFWQVERGGWLKRDFDLIVHKIDAAREREREMKD